jgi:hypothetical protein
MERSVGRAAEGRSGKERWEGAVGWSGGKSGGKSSQRSSGKSGWRSGAEDVHMTVLLEEKRKHVLRTNSHIENHILNGGLKAGI